MTGVPRNIAKHRSNIREGYSPVKQKKRGHAPERNKVIQEEVEKLVDAGIMKEAHYYSWLSNPVMVKKHDGTWRMCVDFKDLNNACPKDCYPLPEIDWKVESLCGYPFKCFLDAYKGYHQIKMAKEDEEKTAFITSQGIFCYSKMPFGLKNAGSTYQRLVDKAFQRQIGRNLEVYVDDLVIKSHTEEEIIRDITETFKTLRQINMKLNPKKCTFGMQEGMFLGRAEAKWKISEFKQILVKISTKKSDFQWTPEAEEAFKQMKKLIAELPTLTAPREHEELIIYLAATKEAISAVLMTDREGRQIPVVFRKPHPTRPGSQLYSHGKVGVSFAQCKQTVEKILPSTHGRYFIVERPEEESPDELMAEPEVLPEPWTLFTDGSSCVDGSGAGLILTNPEGAEFTYAMSFTHLNKQVLVEELKEKSINEKEILDVVEEEGNQMTTPISEYLAKEILPKDKKKARAVRRKAARYAMINGTLYKKSFLGPWLRCVGPLQAKYVLREIHEGSCSMHSGPRSVVSKVIRTGYYWPTMHMDARNLIRKCNDCQIHRSVIRNPQQNLTPITSPWLFYKWGIDIAGPFPEGLGKVKFLIVAIDYFTKWIEANMVVKIPILILGSYDFTILQSKNDPDPT
ncbi:reverse transcriptase domain-containing protein [Tanacetum coccineum]|uniref:Reverse transcriptase domain-containing protein n=1 Tax=Tanacetum coccineum TaxID=301880 RepID=A0ABQ5DHN1_9ASTR